MRKLKSIGALLTGIIVGIILSLGTDAFLEMRGILPHDNLWVSPFLIIFVLFYRTLYNTFSCYLAARLAPRRPMKHAIILGIFGTIVSVIGALATAKMNLGPAWYAWTLAILTLPSAYLGGKIFLMTARRE